MNWRRITAITRKEVTQIRRDPRSLLIAFLLPVIQLLIYGYAVNLDVKHVPLCVYDRDGTQDSQDLLKHFQATDYFNIVRVADDYWDVIHQIDYGVCTVAVVVPPQFAETFHCPERPTYALCLHPSPLAPACALACSEKRPVQEVQIVPFSDEEAVKYSVSGRNIGHRLGGFPKY